MNSCIQGLEISDPQLVPPISIGGILGKSVSGSA